MELGCQDQVYLQNEIDDDSSTRATLIGEVKIKVYWTRWIIAGIVIVFGCQVGVATVIWGTWHAFGVEYFNVSPEEFDIIILGFAIGSVLAAMPLAMIAQQYPNSTRSLLQFGLSLFGFGYLIEAIIIAVREYAFILMLGQFVFGIAICVCFSVAPLAATVWFAEREQGTFFGIFWFAIGLGKVIGSSLPSIMNFHSQHMTFDQESHGLVLTFATLAGIDLVLVLLMACFLPLFPEFPPSMAEAHRLSLSKNVASSSLKQIFHNSFDELKVLFTDRVSIFILFVSTTVLAIFVVQFILMPVPQAFNIDVSNFTAVIGLQQNMTFEESQTQLPRSHALLAFAMGGLLGSMPAGLGIDKIKKYQPLAFIVSISTFFSSVIILLGFHFNLFILQCIGCGFYGFFCFASSCFFNEILKQYLYPTVRETTFGVSISLCLNILVIVYSAILRNILENWSPLGYMITVCVIVMLTLILSFSMNPELKRFNYDTEQTELNRNKRRLRS